MIKQSFCIPLFKAAEMDFDGLFSRAAEIGYAATEIWGRDEQFETMVAAAHRHNLVVASMCGHGTLTKGLNDVKEHDRIERDIRESLELAVRHRIPNLICFSGNRIEGLSEEAALAACVKGFKRLAPLAEKAGVNLNLELLNSRVDHAGYQADHTPWGVAVCNQVGSPRVKLLYDIYHMQIMEGDVIRTIRDNIQWIGHVHTAGNPGRNDLDSDQELYYPAICRALDAAGYNGYVAHEFTPKADRLEALAEAFKVCNVGAASAASH